MRFNGSMTRFVLPAICVLAAIALPAAPPLKAAEQDDLVKQIEKKLSGVQRRTVTEPGRAEKEMIEAREMIGRLKESSPDHEKLPSLQKRADDLAKKLEKRLGRPIGGKAEPEKKEPAPGKTKTPPSDLPSSVTSRLKKMDTALTAAEAALEKDQLQTSTRKLSEAQKLMDEIQKRYAAKIPAGNAEMKAASERLQAVAARVSDADASAAADAAAKAAQEEQMEAQSAEWIDKLQPFFDYKSDQYLRFGAEFNRATDEEKQKCREAYARANELMPVFKKTEFPLGKTPMLLDIEQRLDRYLTVYNEEEARARQEESCSKWVETFREYVDSGTGSRKYLVVGVTLSEDQINERSALLDEAKALWPEYEKAEFPLGKSPRLLELEEEMLQRFEEMPESLRKSRALVSGDIAKELERLLNYLNADTGWQSDPLKKPNIAMERDITPLHDAVERFAVTVEPNDAKLSDLKAALDRIAKQDVFNRTICAERTFMIPDSYGGGDAGDLRQKVEEIVKAKFAQAEILRTTLPAGDWKEEKVVEWTDTTRTALQYRVTRFMTAQAATKGTDGKVYLHGVHLVSDRQSDGSWGPLHGHIMWSDWMAEKNVDRKPSDK